MFDISIVFNISAVIPSHPALLLFFKIYIFLHISFTLNGYFVCVGLIFLTSKHPLLNCFLKYICMSFYCSLQFAIKPPYLFLQGKWFWFSSICIFAYLKLSGRIIFGSISHKWLSIFSSFNTLTQWCVSVRIAFLSFQSSFSLPWSLISLRWSLDSSVLVR